ncbi:hypothetical protein JCM33374_g891 [Metschnikowia sp. JCM 33374]|nr:hypothetical protein JCM33374_g891 [Metschnikowia sp. JCM 33374]
MSQNKNDLDGASKEASLTKTISEIFDSRIDLVVSGKRFHGFKGRVSTQEEGREYIGIDEKLDTAAEKNGVMPYLKKDSKSGYLFKPCEKRSTSLTTISPKVKYTRLENEETRLERDSFRAFVTVAVKKESRIFKTPGEIEKSLASVSAVPVNKGEAVVNNHFAYRQCCSAYVTPYDYDYAYMNNTTCRIRTKSKIMEHFNVKSPKASQIYALSDGRKGSSCFIPPVACFYHCLLLVSCRQAVRLGSPRDPQDPDPQPSKQKYQKKNTQKEHHQKHKFRHPKPSETMLRFASRSFSVATPSLSAYTHQPRKTITHLHQLYRSKTPISVVTAWDYLTAQITQNADIDVTLVGDSLAMVALGYDDTNQIELDEFLYHVRAVSRGNKTSFIVADVPFGTFEASEAEALQTAIALIKRGRAQGVKIEGGEETASTISKIVSAGIPVMGHVGLAPQKHNATGGYRLQGNTEESALQILKDCKALEKAGVFALLLECVPNKFAELITSQVSVPVIGIGAGPHVSGQVLVMADMLGMNDKTPAKFVKKYLDFHTLSQNALAQYKADLADGSFPDPDTHGYKMKSEVLRRLKEHVSSV